MKDLTITLKDIPCFGESPVSIALAKTNYIYGPNGSGKSSISRKIADKDFSPNLSATECILFDENYIRRFIDPENTIKGVFKIRAASEEVQNRLTELEGTEKTKGEIETAENQQARFQTTLQDKEKELEGINEDLVKTLWDVKSKYDGDLGRFAFAGFHRNRIKFKDECLKRYETVSEEESVNDAAALLRKLKAVESGDSASTIKKLPSNITALVAPESVRDVMSQSHSKDASNRLSSLLDHLGHQGWVHSGVNYLENLGDICPFCQQSIDSSLRAEIKDLFDAAYETAQKTLNEFEAQLHRSIDSLDYYTAQITDIEQVNTEKARLALTEVRGYQARLLRQVQQKLTDMTLVIHAESATFIYDLARELSELNEAIQDYNDTISNRRRVSGDLKNEIWSHFLSQAGVAASVAQYQSKRGQVTKAIDSLGDRARQAAANLSALKKERSGLLEHVSSAEEVLKGVNALLEAIGFSNFKLSLHGNSRDLYSIVRGDGSLAGATLSEGEKTLISFLYFYDWIVDKVNDKSADGDIWVVLDDPISSLDVQTLSVISHLCRKLNDLCIRPGNRLGKVILLTHNAYFFQEVVYLDRRVKSESGDRLYGVIKKSSSATSEISMSEENSIDSTYNLLWAEIRAAQEEGTLSVHIPNAMRRVLESYFKLVEGGYEGIVDRMAPELQPTGMALLSWINDGSHRVNWDIDRASTSLDHGLYYSAFKEIFSVSGYDKHYEYMMSQ